MQILNFATNARIMGPIFQIARTVQLITYTITFAQTVEVNARNAHKMAPTPCLFVVNA
jgi:hypothetical protein